MGTPRSKKETQAALDLIAEHKTDTEIAEQLNIPRTTVRDIRTRGGDTTARNEPPAEGFEDDQEAGKRTLRSVSTTIRTVAQALVKGGVDPAVWKVRQCKVNSWEVASKHPKTGEVTTTPLWQVAVWLEAISQDELQAERILALTVEQMKAHAPVYDLAQLAPVPKIPGRMLELDLFDVHLGLLSWPAETGASYDTEIAATRYMRTVERLLSLAGAQGLSAVLLPTGNDFLHTDTEAGTTTSHTPVDVDTRATKVFERGKLLLIHCIDRLLQVAPKVIVPIIPGNHDRLSMLHLGHVLAAWYRNLGDRVEIDFSPRLRKYVEYGSSLLGFTHGSEEKKERLPMLMAHEQPEAWARTKHRHWRVGHLHHKRRLLLPIGDTLDGVYIKQSAALASRDAWHTKKGFVMAPPAASATLWDLRDGPVVEFNLQVEGETR